MNPTFVFWDTETTGLDRAFHGPVDYAGVVTDTSLRPIHNIDISCRPPRFVLPEPGALQTTKTSIGELLRRPLSAYEAACRFAQEVRAATPTCFVGYNCVSFDHPLIQHCLYRHLHDPYLMMKGGNCRIDMLRMVQLAYSLGQGDLVVPISDTGKAIFKLDRIAPLNGFDEAGAHAALVDARAVHHLARLIAQRAPELWDRAVRLWSRKDAVRNLLCSTDLVVQFSWVGNRGLPAFKALVPIGVGRGYAGDFVCLDLAMDRAEYASLSPEELAGEVTIGPKPRPICTIRLNGVPIIFNHDDPLVRGRVPVESEVLAERAHRIRSDADLRDRILDAVDLSRDRFEEPEHPEQQLYSGGFFSNRDMMALERFHQVAPAMKLHVARTFDDTRLRYLAQRLIYEEWPAVLPSEIRCCFDAELLDRCLSLAECPWVTLSAGIAAIDKLLPGADDRGRAILTEYRGYLMRYPLSEAAE